MMRKLLFILSFIIISSSQAQDTVYDRSPEISITDFSHQSFRMLSDCAHGHICCQVGCHCCMELDRTQHYDTIYHPEQNGVQRITIVERYFYASSHEPSPVHFRFKDSLGELSPKWYLAEQTFGFYYEIDGFDRYPREIEERYLDSNCVLVMDEMGSFQRIDLQGNLLPMKFHSRRKVKDNVFLSMIIVNNQRYYGFSDSSGALIGPLKYNRVLPFNEYGIAVVVDIHGLHGCVDSTGKEVLPPTYHNLTEIGTDRYSVSHNNQFWMINLKGEFISKEGYVRIEKYGEGKVFAQQEKELWVCLDKNGKKIFSLKTEWTMPFQDGMAAVFRNKKWGFVDTTGKLVIDYLFDRACSFEDGVAPVQSIKPFNEEELGLVNRHGEYPKHIMKQLNHQEWYLIDRKGHSINNHLYSELSNFKNGIARTMIRGKGVGLINTKGKEVLPCQYLLEGNGTPTDWYIDGTILVTTLGQEHYTQLLDRNGNQLLNLSKYRGANYVIVPNTPDPLPYLIVYKENVMRTLIDYSGKEILSKDYETLTVLNEQLAVGSIGSNNYLIDLTTDQHLVEFSDKTYYSFQDDLLMIETQDYPRTYEYYNLKGEKVKVNGE